MKPRVCLILLTVCFLHLAKAQPEQPAEVRIGRYLDSIRTQEAQLTAFFSLMPKGGDLHHHLSGSIYGETFLEVMEQQNFWIDEQTLDIQAERPRRKRRRWQALQERMKRDDYPDLRRRLLERWSVLDYVATPEQPAYEQFFDSFSAFGPAIAAAQALGMSRIRERAIQENVQYIETMFTRVGCSGPSLPYAENINRLMQYIQGQRDEEGLYQLFDLAMEDLQKGQFEQCAQAFGNRLAQVHDSLGIDDERFTMRYQTYVLRVDPPGRVFQQMALAFEAARQHPLIVGVNIVAPEHHPVALRDYWLHMHMFRYLSRRYPEVNKALHAGELVLGLVRPEDLSWHIRAAVEIAGARRIGHGVDLPHETDWPGLLQRLRNDSIAVEINLSSNAFILGVEGGEHPLLLYRRAGVPLVISTDDAGVLRDNLTSQYVRLARQYPEISYKEIKNYVYNSIRFSFIEEEALKDGLRARLDEAFVAFENRLVQWLEKGE